MMTRSLGPDGRVGEHAAHTSIPAATMPTKRAVNMALSNTPFRAIRFLEPSAGRRCRRCGSPARRFEWRALLERVEDSAVRDVDALVVRARDGDADAYALLVRQFQEVAFRLAYLVLGDAAEAEDATQEAFIKAFYA